MGNTQCFAGLTQLWEGTADATAAPDVAAPAAKSVARASIECWSADGQQRLVMGKYWCGMRPEDVVGEGTDSVCRRGTSVSTREEVAIKTYRIRKEDGRTATWNVLKQFNRQIQALRELERPFVPSLNADLWHEELAHVTPDALFVKLIDHSVNASGQPGFDVDDGVLYVVTELAEGSLHDYLQWYRAKRLPLPKETVRAVSKAILLIAAGLHAKGLVHLDLKPENLMMFNGRLKLIDVDSCVRSGTTLFKFDTSLSFSPCYCAPEWARFLVTSMECAITASPSLDAWSVGMTICELVHFDAILRPRYEQCEQACEKAEDGMRQFLEYIGVLSSVALPQAVATFDQGLRELVELLLICDGTERSTVARCLSSPYIASVKL